MPRIITERNILGMGKVTGDSSATSTRKFSNLIQEIEPETQRAHRNRSNDKMYRSYIVPSTAAMRDGALRGRYSADTISE